MRTRNTANADESVRMLSLKESAVYLGLGLNKARELLETIGATRHFGSRVLFDRTVIDKYLDSLGA